MPIELHLPVPHIPPAEKQDKPETARRVIVISLLGDDDPEDQENGFEVLVDDCRHDSDRLHV